MAVLQAGHELHSAVRSNNVPFLFCSRCGAFVEATATGLRQQCPRLPATKALREQLSALRRQRFPIRAEARRGPISRVSPATAAQAAWIGRKWMSALEPAKWRLQPAGRREQPRDSILRCFGMTLSVRERLLAKTAVMPSPVVALRLLLARGSSSNST